jgi:hypothetical protein
MTGGPVNRRNGFLRRLARRCQAGQASMEYTVVTFFAVLVLILPDENGNVAIIQVANALKVFYSAFAYAISLSTNMMPM